MIIFKDKLTDAEMASDSFACKTDDTGTMLEIKGKLVTYKESSDFDIGGNPSQEEQEEQCEAGVSSGIDIVLNHKLQEVEMLRPIKKHLGMYMKKYLKLIQKDIPEDELKEWQSKFQEAFKKLLEQIDDYTFYVGEGQDGAEILTDGTGMVAFCRWEGETPVMCYIKKGLVEEKC